MNSANASIYERPGTLYIVAVPIGNSDDITLRAIRILQQADEIVCEELAAAARLLKSLGITKPLISLNEHNEHTQADGILQKLLGGSTLALISDAGTPLFSDPGRYLLKKLAGTDIQTIPVPGPSSLTAALCACSFEMKQFLFAGFLNRERPKRILELQQYARSGLPVVLMDTPYRMMALLEDVKTVFGPRQEIFLASDMTQPTERFYRGTVQTVLKRIDKRKSEFILILDRR
jgi:16S rRNA (cytidine1402-2'-O)-methyltransferase